MTSLNKSKLMKTRVFLFLITCLSPSFMFAGENTGSDYGILFGGFIKNDFFYDTRQTVDAREGHFLLWPAKPSPDAEDNDVNSTPSFNFLSVQTRLNAAITVPDAFGVKTSGFVEGAFFGHSNSDINGFRLRHAFVKFETEKSELLFGQFWNPMFIAASFPGVVSFNTGCPFQAFSRNPQIRLTRTLGQFKVVAAALSQRDFANAGPAGASSRYLRNSVMPDMHFQVHYTTGNPDAGTRFNLGAGTAYKRIVPEISTSEGYKTDASVAGVTYMGYASARLLPVTIKAQYIIGQNVTDMLMIGGYGISRVTDPARGIVEYAPVRTGSFWLDVHTNGKAFQIGMFLGRSENLGTSKNLAAGTSTTGLGTDIRELYRISPRVVFNSGKARFAFECEYTSAGFGTVDVSENVKGIPVNINDIGNLRLLLGVYLFL